MNIGIYRTIVFPSKIYRKEDSVVGRIMSHRVLILIRYEPGNILCYMIRGGINVADGIKVSSKIALK